jgi:hypothetical protein
MRRNKACTQAAAVIVLLLSASLLAACGSSSTTSATAPINTSPASSSGPISLVTPSDVPSTTPAAALTSAAPAASAISGTVTDSQGDAATVNVNIGTPVPQLSLNQAELIGCSSEDGPVISDGANQNMAIPLQFTVTLTSSIATDVGLEMVGSYVVAPGGNINSNPNAVTDTWVTYTSDSACGGGGSDDSLVWDNVTPGQSVTWSGWEIDPDAITPDDMTGSAASQVMFLQPGGGFGDGSGVFTIDGATSQNLVNCPGLVNGGAAVAIGGPVIAVNPSVALTNGCTAYTGS